MRISTLMTFALLLMYADIVCRDPLPDSQDRPWPGDLGGPSVSDIGAISQLLSSNPWISPQPPVLSEARRCERKHCCPERFAYLSRACLISCGPHMLVVIKEYTYRDSVELERLPNADIAATAGGPGAIS